jgi:hypothetical protein
LGVRSEADDAKEAPKAVVKVKKEEKAAKKATKMKPSQAELKLEEEKEAKLTAKEMSAVDFAVYVSETSAPAARGRITAGPSWRSNERSDRQAKMDKRASMSTGAWVLG